MIRSGNFSNRQRTHRCWYKVGNSVYNPTYIANQPCNSDRDGEGRGAGLHGGLTIPIALEEQEAMALFPAGYMKAIVSLGVSDGPFAHVGTGFLYYCPIGKEEDRTQYRPFLVTNKHVMDGGIQDVRFNHPVRGSPEVHALGAVTDGDWTTHPDGADVAVIPLLSPGPLTLGRKVMKAEIFVGDVCTPSANDLTSMTEGTGVFLIGFPLGLIGDARSFPIVRSGTIARIQDWLSGEEDTFLIDAPAFPGNSGGPVIVRPDTTAISGTTAITHALLVGVVSQTIRSREVAVSAQTGEQRVVFLENTGLSSVVPISAIQETLTSAV